MQICVQITKTYREMLCTGTQRDKPESVCHVFVRLTDGGCEGREVKEEDAVCVCMH